MPQSPPYIHHVTLEVDPQDVDECLTFYRDLLGLSEVAPPNGLKSSIWFTEGLHLYYGVFAPKLYRRWRRRNVPARHFALAVGDRYEAIVAKCKEKDLWLQDATQYWGSPRSYVCDPAGNRVELMKFAP